MNIETINVLLEKNKYTTQRYLYFGYQIGYKVIHRYCYYISIHRIPCTFLSPPLSSLAAIKIICTDFWSFLFGKIAERLQTDKKGVYIISDNDTSIFSILGNPSESRTLGNHETVLVDILRGIIEGALASLGHNSNVTVNSFLKSNSKIN